METPYQSHSSTSKAAATAIKPSAATYRERVFDILKSEGPLTDEEIQVKLGMNPSTQRPRRIELVAAGRVEDSGSVRATRSGRSATVWRITS